MLVKDVLGECLTKMGKDNFLVGEMFSDAEQALTDRLLAALNIAYKEAVTEYIPLYAEEETDAEDGLIDISGLGHRIIYPVSFTAGGMRCRLWSRPDGVAVNFRGKGVLRYAYLPEDFSVGDSIDDMRLTPSVLSDGTLAEYWFQDKVFDLAEAYAESFRMSLSRLRYKGRAMRLGAGRRSL